MKRLVLLLFLAPSLFAQHEYIIPIVGSAAGIEADHFAEADVLNPTARTAHIRVTGVYPVYPAQQCEPVVPAELAPRSRGGVGFHFTCPVRQLAAVTIESDEPLDVKTSITSFLRLSDVTISDVQQIRAGTWIPFAAEALAYGELDEQLGLRANLLLINPNPFGLRVRVALHRPEANASREETLNIAPRSTILHPLPAVSMPATGFPAVLTGHHDVIVSADGRFWAGVSSITTNGGNHFEEAIALKP
jgi:hypothetical protein